MLLDQGEGRVEVAVAEPAQVLDRGERPGDGLVRLRARLEAVPGRILGGRPHPVRRQRRREVGPDRRDPEVRPEELVRRAEQDVQSDLSCAQPPMGRHVHRVRPRKRADAVRGRCDAAGIRNRPDRVRCQRERHHAGALSDQLLEGVDVERHVLGPQRRGAHHQVVIRGHHEPGRDVRVVVERGHDDLVSWRHRAGHGMRELEVERRHVRSERDAIHLAAGEVRRGSAALLHQLVRRPRGRERAAEIGIRSRRYPAMASITDCGTCEPPGPSKKAASEAEGREPGAHGGEVEHGI